MTLKAMILGGTAAAALMCAGLATPSFAQQQPATPDQSAPAAAAPATPDATTAKDTMTSKPKHHARRHHKIHSARMEKGSEYAETRRLNQEQLAKAQGGAQGSYGTMEQQQAPAAPPSDMNAPQAPNAPTPGQTMQNMENKATAPIRNNVPPAANPTPNPQPPQN